MRCRWYKDPNLPEGRVLVPGCWSRAINGDDAPCHCPKPSLAIPERALGHVERLAACDLTQAQMKAVIDYLRQSRASKRPRA